MVGHGSKSEPKIPAQFVRHLVFVEGEVHARDPCVTLGHADGKGQVSSPQHRVAMLLGVQRGTTRPPHEKQEEFLAGAGEVAGVHGPYR